jgi:hypothetical protein
MRPKPWWFPVRIGTAAAPGSLATACAASGAGIATPASSTAAKAAGAIIRPNPGRKPVAPYPSLIGK